MQMVASRTYLFIDSDTLETVQACEALLRDEDGSFVLYMVDWDENVALNRNERLVHLDCRQAIVWINEAPENYGSFWE